MPHISTIAIYLIWVGLMSLITFAVWGWDKAAAINGNWRTPEKVLLSLVFLGGAAGGALGMYLFRHKTRKPAFRIALWIAGILQITLLVLLITRNS